MVRFMQTSTGLQTQLVPRSGVPFGSTQPSLELRIALMASRPQARTAARVPFARISAINLYDPPHVHASAESAVRFSESSSFGNLLAHLPSELRLAAGKAVVSDLAAIAAPDGKIA